MLTRRGNRVVLDASEQRTSVADSALLRRVLDRARSPVELAELAELAQLVQELVPDADADQARDYLRRLREQGFLLEGERPRRSLTDAPAPASGQPTDTPPTRVDLHMDAGLTVPPTLAREVADAAHALWRLTPDQAASPALDRFHERFLHAYGTDRLVPLLDLLDEHLGLGPPDGYRHPPSRSEPDPPTSTHPIERDELLADLLDGSDELVLDGPTIDRLASPGERPPPRTFDLGVSVHATDVSDLEQGRYLLCCTNGSITGGATIGRFAEMLGVTDDLARLVDHDRADIVAEVLTPTMSPRQSNVTPPTRATPAAVEIGVVDDRIPKDRIDIRDVAIGSTGHTLYAVDARARRVIDPVRLNMVNAATALPNAARLLGALPLGGRRMWAPWDWGRLSALPRLPRVLLGRVVLAPQRWRPPVTLRESTDDTVEFDRRLARWRTEQQVPARVRVAENDQRLDLDLDHPTHRALLREHLRRHPRSQVEEAPEGWCRAHGIDDPHGLMDGHACELVLPVVTPSRAEPVGPPAVPWASLSTQTATHLPGGSWLSAKVYAESDLHDRLIATGVDGLLDHLGPDAFLLRYADPDPHLRVRVPTAEPATRDAALRDLHDWAERATGSALVRTIVLDAYAPETDRYGGPAAMGAAERVFACDTTLVRDLLSDKMIGDLPGGRPTLAATSCLDLLEAFAGDDADVDEWLLSVLPAALSHAVPAATRRAAQRLVVGGLDALREGRAAAVATARRVAASAHGELAGPLTGAGHSAALSLMHLHCNRLLGLSQQHEHVTYGVLRSAATARAGRRRALA